MATKNIFSDFIDCLFYNQLKVVFANPTFFIFFSLIAINQVYAQSNKNDSQPKHLSNAKILIELPDGRQGTCTTNKDGVFGIHFSNIDNIQNANAKEIDLKITITPPNDFKQLYSKNTYTLTLSKTNGPYYEFTLKFLNTNSKGNLGEFLIQLNTKPTIKQGGKQGKGSAVKTGESYQGEVMHF